MPELQLPSGLHSAVENLYSVYGRYPVRQHVEGCEHCVGPDAHARLTSKPLRELAPSDLSLFAWKAMTTWGTTEDYKHFLPRIYELMLLGDGYPFDLATLAWKLTEGQWRLWPPPEQDSLNALFHETWQWLLASEATEPFELDLISVGLFLQSISRVRDVVPFLATWEPHRSLRHLDHLGKLVFESAVEMGGRHLLGSSWDRYAAASDRLTTWLTQTQSLATLERALAAYAERWNPQALPDLMQQLHNAFTVTLARKADVAR
jgi:hypothetical protein